MGKHVRSGILAMLMVVLMALPAFAQGSATVNVALNVAREVMGIPRDLTITPPAGLNAVVYGNAQDLQVANIIFITLNNATFQPGVAYLLCDNAGAQISNFTTPGAQASGTPVPFQLSAGVQIGVNNPIHVTSDGACSATDDPFAFRLLTAGTSATVNFRAIGVGGTVLDQTPNATLVNAVQEYSIIIDRSRHFVDVIAGNGSQFTPQTGVNAAGVPNTPPFIMADSIQTTFPPTLPVGSPASITIGIAATNVDDGTLGLTTRARITLNDTNSFQGVQRVFIAALGTACDSTAAVGTPGNLAGVNSPSNGSNFLIPAGTFSATTLPPNVQFRTCVLANGVDFLSAPRDISATVAIEMCVAVGDSGCVPPPSSTGVVQHWDLSGGDIRISGIRADAATNNNTLININNLGPTDGQIVKLEVFKTQVAATQAAPACTINNVPGVTIFANGGTQFTAQQINSLCAAQAPDLNTIVYAARMVLSFAPGNLSANAFRQFPDGVFLELPVLKLGNAYANE